MTSATRTGKYVGPMPELDEVGSTLLDAAGRLLTTEGPEALTVRRIAGEARMSTMNVYSRFGSKEGVVERLFINAFGLLADALNAVPTTDDALADLRNCRTAYRRFAHDNPGLYSVMFERAIADFEPSPSAMAVAASTLDVLARRISRAMDAGAISRADPVATAAVVWCTCHGVVSLELKGIDPHGIDFDVVYATATDAVIAGLAPAPAADRPAIP
jgi:AcrR family transcriptional regulator